MRLFLDTNVLFDYISGREPFFYDAQALALMKTFGDVELSVSGKSYTDVFYVLRKYRNSQQVQQSFVNSLELFDVCSLEQDDLTAACGLGWQDFEDALIATSAQKAGADYLVTRDAAFERSLVPAKTPEQIVELFAEQGLSFAEIDLAAVDADALESDA
ncbi:MAG: PIN domain-containing protein [Coriobacteriia bacterium]|nr:PIN domain-containing protein [Coriobacteriia bacterium]